MHTIPSPSVSRIFANPTPQPVARRMKAARRPRILIVTPELNGSTFLARNGQSAPCAKAGGLADVSTLLVDKLADRGIDVRIAMPNFRNLFPAPDAIHSRRLFLCRDREFNYRRSVYDGTAEANRRAALAFQREVIHHVLPRVRPDIVHCHDWMTGLVPAAAKSMGIPSLFTLHNLHDDKVSLAEIEDRGIDAGPWWQHLHFHHFPQSYGQSREWNPVSMLASGIHSADQFNTVSPTFLQEMMEGRHASGHGLIDVLWGKERHGAACGIVNAPDPSCSPVTDPRIVQRYDATTHASAKRVNKLHLQQKLGLEMDAEAPVLFWPSRLDPVQKGCGLLAEMLYRLVSDYWAPGLQVVFVADGPFQQHFQRIADFHGLGHRIAVRPFEESLSRQAYAGSDFVLMPSAYEPCGLAQMVALKYGSLPVVHRTGGLADTVRHLDAATGHGNGFSFEHHDCGGLRWAIDEAMRFHMAPAGLRHRTVERVMGESEEAFSPKATTEKYIRLYESLSRRTI